MLLSGASHHAPDINKKGSSELSTQTRLVQFRMGVLYIFYILANKLYAGVWMPHLLSKKYPHANKSLQWQFIFPSHKLSADPETGEIRRHHFDHSSIRKAVKSASVKSKINKLVTPHTFRHSFATHVLQQGANGVTSPLSHLQ